MVGIDLQSLSIKSVPMPEFSIIRHSILISTLTHGNQQSRRQEPEQNYERISATWALVDSGGIRNPEEIP